MFAALDDPSLFLVHDVRFHRALLTGSGNAVFAHFAGTVEAPGRFRSDGGLGLACSGGTAGPGVLALRPAPVLATWLGYLNTTGLRAVDYRITDRHADPAGFTGDFRDKPGVFEIAPGGEWTCSTQVTLLP